MSRKIAFLALCLVLANVPYSKGQTITPQDIDAAVKNHFGDKAYYSALACKGSTSFCDKTYPDLIISKMVVYENKPGTHTIQIGYPKLPKTATQSTLGQTNKFWGEWSRPRVPINEDAMVVKGNFTYREPTNSQEPMAFAGVIEESDGSMTFVFVPAMAKDVFTKEKQANLARGHVEVYNMFDYDNLSYDRWFKDQAAATNADLEGRKKELIALVQENIREDDKKRADAAGNAKPDPEGLKLAADLRKSMMTMAQDVWDKQVCRDHRLTPLGITGAKISKIWAVDNDWTPVKDQDGITIHHRFIWAEAIFKTSGKCFLYKIKFTELYAGGGTYTSQIDYDNIAASQSTNCRMLGCENAK